MGEDLGGYSTARMETHIANIALVDIEGMRRRQQEKMINAMALEHVDRSDPGAAALLVDAEKALFIAKAVRFSAQEARMNNIQISYVIDENGERQYEISDLPVHDNDVEEPKIIMKNTSEEYVAYR
jgi:hypothetical protein